MSHIARLIIILAALNLVVVAPLIALWPWVTPAHNWLWLAAGLFFVLQLMGPVGDRIGLRYHPSQLLKILSRFLSFTAYAALGLFSSLFVYTLALEIAGVIAKLFVTAALNRSFDQALYLILGVVTLASTLIGVLTAKSEPEICRVTVPLANLPTVFDGFTIAQISDLHISQTIGAAYLKPIVAMTNALKPDLIALTGDFADGPASECGNELAAIADLHAPYGKFFITGNHEYYWGADAWMQTFRQLGARVLVNEHVVLRHGNGDGLVLAGVTDYSTLHMTGQHASDPERAAAGAPAGLVKILLAHQPASYRAASAAGFALQLSGHTHGGQYFPLTLFIRFFQRFYQGLNRYERLWIYVNRGVGYWGPPLRTANRPELTLLTLRRAA